MKATLIIEVPDNFKKGDWGSCDFGTIDKIKSSDATLRVQKEICLLLDGKLCSSETCPLEIKEELISCVGVCRDCIKKSDCDKKELLINPICTEWRGE